MDDPASSSEKLRDSTQKRVTLVESSSIRSIKQSAAKVEEKETEASAASQGHASATIDGDSDAAVARSKLQRATRKAAHTFELARAFDTSNFREKIDGYLGIPIDSRTEAHIDEFLSATVSKGRYKFFNSYSELQQRQLARIARHRRCEKDEVLFKQEDNPDALYLIVNGRCGMFKVQGENKKMLGASGTGDSIGDLTHLDERCRRSCTAQITSDHADLIMFKRADLDVLSHQWRIAEEKAKTEFMTSNVPVLNSVPRDMLATLAPSFERMRIPKDTVVYRQQDDANVIYFIWEGQVQLIKRIDLMKVVKKPTLKMGQAGLGGQGKADVPFEIPAGPKKVSKSLPVGILGPGEYFGEVEVFNESPRTSAVISMSECTLLVLAKTQLESMPATFLDALYRYSFQRVQWRNSRINLLLDCLHNINWVPERDAKLSLEPEIKPLPKMKTAMLPMATQPGSEIKGWLGAHTVMSDEDAREWGMYHCGPWARPPDKVDQRLKEDKEREEEVQELQFDSIDTDSFGSSLTRTGSKSPISSKFRSSFKEKKKVETTPFFTHTFNRGVVDDNRRARQMQ